MTAISLSKPDTTFHYRIRPSLFKLAEAPTYIAWKILKSSYQLWNQEAANSSQDFMNRSLAVLSGIGGYVAGFTALPITFAFTPVTVVADVIIGLAECSFCYYHGLSGNDIKEIARRKFVVSPLQQAVFCASAISAAFVIKQMFPFGIIFWCVPFLRSFPAFAATLWPMGYYMGQFVVGSLPSNLNHQEFNIFIGNGSGHIEGRSWLQEGEEMSNEAKIVREWNKRRIAEEVRQYGFFRALIRDCQREARRGI